DPSAGQPLDLQTTDGTTSMWVIDGTGNPAAAIADTGKTAYTVAYDPYGVETVKAGGDSAQWQQNPYGFKAGLRSSSTDNGLTKFGYRWQSSTTGAWIERDTLDAPLSPSNANRYAYVGGDPVNAQDSTGLATPAEVYDVVCGPFVNLGVAGLSGIGGVYGYIGGLSYGAGCVIFYLVKDRPVPPNDARPRGVLW
ncbi:RHS repeat-associated core domain-containing protein, partial [Curtobacterium sp. 18060]